MEWIALSYLCQSPVYFIVKHSAHGFRSKGVAQSSVDHLYQTTTDACDGGIKEMQELAGSGIIDIGLSGTIQFHQTNENMECVVLDISEDCGEIDVAMPEPRACDKEAVELTIYIPAEKTPIRCMGTMFECLGDYVLPEDQDGCPAQILITEMGRMDRRRLELFIAKKKAYISGGSPTSIFVNGNV